MCLFLIKGHELQPIFIMLKKIKNSFFLVCLLAFSPLTLWSQDEEVPHFKYFFEIDPPIVSPGGVLTGTPGEKVKLTIYATIETSQNTTDIGVTGWTLSIHGEGLNFIPGSENSKDVVGIPLFWFSPTVVNPNKEGHPETVFAGAPQGEGVIDGVALSLSRELELEGTQRMLKVEAEVEIPSIEDGRQTVRLAFIDGKTGLSQPIDNEVTFTGLTFTPNVMEELTFDVAPATFIRGDADANGSIEITDVIFTLSHLFLGATAPVCPNSADVDDNGVVELTDAIVSLGYQYLGQAPPPAPGPFNCGPDTTPAEPALESCRYPLESCE